MTTFQIISSDGHQLSLQGVNLLRIGRDHSNDVVLNDPSVSRHHASILLNSGRVWIRDENSRGGVFINGARIYGQSEWMSGGTMQIGNINFQLTAQQFQSQPSYALAPQNQLDTIYAPNDYGYGAQPMPPQYPQHQPPMPPPMIPPGAPYGVDNRKEKTTATIIETIGPIIGFLGVGWMFAGQMQTGILIFIGWLVGNFVLGMVDAVTFGFGLCLHIPLYFGIWFLSVKRLQDFMNRNPALYK